MPLPFFDEKSDLNGAWAADVRSPSVDCRGFEVRDPSLGRGYSLTIMQSNSAIL